MHENRETCGAPVNQTGRSAKAQSQTADAYALQESDRCAVPVKQPNKEGQPLAEAVEGRQRPKENDAQSSTRRKTAANRSGRPSSARPNNSAAPGTTCCRLCGPTAYMSRSSSPKTPTGCI